MKISRWEILPDGHGARCPSRGCNFVAAAREGKTVVCQAAQHNSEAADHKEERVIQFGGEGPVLKPLLDLPFIDTFGKIRGLTVEEGVRLYLEKYPEREVKVVQTDQGIPKDRKRKRKVYFCGTVARFSLSERPPFESN